MASKGRLRPVSQLTPECLENPFDAARQLREPFVQSALTALNNLGRTLNVHNSVLDFYKEYVMIF